MDRNAIRSPSTAAAALESVQGSCPSCRLREDKTMLRAGVIQRGRHPARTSSCKDVILQGPRRSDSGRSSSRSMSGEEEGARSATVGRGRVAPMRQRPGSSGTRRPPSIARGCVRRALPDPLQAALLAGSSGLVPLSLDPFVHLSRGPRGQTQPRPTATAPRRCPRSRARRASRRS